MTRFTYTAEKNSGEVYQGVVEAPDRFGLYAIVRKEGGRIVSVEEDYGKSLMSLDYWIARFKSISEYEKVLMARNLGAMLSAGLALARALAVLERQTKNNKLRSVLSEVAGSVRRGDPLHVALAQFPDVFSNLFIAMVRAGEAGGDLAQALTIVADQSERMYNLKSKIKGAMTYPAIILVAIVGIGGFMLTQVVPTLAQTFIEMHAQLPFSTQLIISLSDFLVHNFFLAVGLLIGFVLVFLWALRTTMGARASDWVFLRLPAIGTIVKEINAARTARTLASLLASGVDILSALEITQEVVQNTYFREVIAEAKKRVGQGEPLSTVFTQREDLYPAFVGEMMAVGEETGQTNEMLKRLAAFYEDEVDRKTKDMSTIIEPFLMVFIGGAVGFFAVSMIAPIYSLSQNL